MSKTYKKIIITGTHHTPAIELINQLNRDKKFCWVIYYIAHPFPSETHLSQTIIPQLHNNFLELNSGKFDRRSLIKTVLGVPNTLIALIKAYFLIRQIQPDIIVSFGGYISVPVIIGAYLNHIPSISHEQTHTISLSTRINSFFATKIALTFTDTALISLIPKSKLSVTGNLIRTSIFKSHSVNFSKLTSLLKHRPLLYITGGNQGSSAINRLVVQSLPLLINKFTIVHQTGKIDYTSIVQKTLKYKHHYLAKEYIGQNDIGWLLNNAKVIVSRGGANTTQEIAALHKPAVIIPLPYTQQNEQQLNATWLRNMQPDKTIVCNQLRLSPRRLTRAIHQLASLPEHPKSISHQPNQKILTLIHELL